MILRVRQIGIDRSLQGEECFCPKDKKPNIKKIYVRF